MQKCLCYKNDTTKWRIHSYKFRAQLPRLKENFTGDLLDEWDALWILVDCFEKQGKTGDSLATCDELLVRRGREQTEMSSCFWGMIVEKRDPVDGDGGLRL